MVKPFDFVLTGSKPAVGFRGIDHAREFAAIGRQDRAAVLTLVLSRKWVGRGLDASKNLSSRPSASLEAASAAFRIPIHERQVPFDRAQSVG